MSTRAWIRATRIRQFLAVFACLTGLLVESGAHASVARDAVRADIDGIDVVVLKTDVNDVVTVVGSLRAGDDRSPEGDVALATVTGSMIDKGTTKQDKFAIAQELGNVGAGLSFGVSESTVDIRGRCLRKDLPLLVSLLAQQLREPALADAELAKVKKQLEGAIRSQLDDPDFRADNAFTRAIYPPGHPNRQPTPEAFLTDLAKTTVEEVRRFHSQFYGPTGMRLVIVGDVDPVAAQAEIRKAFAGWRGGSIPPAPPKASRLEKAEVETIFIPDKSSVTVLMGQPTELRFSDPDLLPLRLGTRILGSGGFTSRLMSTVRDREGLTYGIFASTTNDMFADGDWRLQADFAPSLLDKGLASTKREVDSWRNAGVTDDELKRAKSELAGLYQVGLATTGGMAGTILAMLNRGMPLSFVDEYPKKIAAISREQVNDAIKRHVDPSRMVLVKAGTIEGGVPAAK
jgi:zinc protease